MPRSLVFGFATCTCAGALIAVAVATACVTAPPPDLPTPVQHRPTILHDAVVPPTDQILTELPSQFLVPIELDDPDETYQYAIFVDYNPCADPSSCQPTAPVFESLPQTATPGTIDGGVTIQPFSITGSVSASACHRIDFLVAHAFNPTSPHTWDSVGGDIVTWFYNAGGGTDGCPEYDAGSFQDGAFPSADASTDSLPVAPESGAGDP